VPIHIVYDNACNLMQFCLRRTNDSKRTPALANTLYVVDRLHIKNHTDSMCHEICHPYKIPSMNGVNSMVCEQTNYDTGKGRPGTKHMNVERYNFFLSYLTKETMLNLMAHGFKGTNHSHKNRILKQKSVCILISVNFLVFFIFQIKHILSSVNKSKSQISVFLAPP